MYDKDYTITMRLHIRNVHKVDFTSYKCVSKNNLGETDGLIQVEGEFSLHLNLNVVCAKMVFH